MGNFISDYASQNINQTQISTTSQICNESASSTIQGTTITAIDSHMGDITLSSTVNVGDMKCVLNAVSKSAEQVMARNIDHNKISSIPFQFNVNVVSIKDITDIQSFQQSVIDQACTETANSSIVGSYLTFIDTTTGNVKVASTSQVNSFSCNLQASTYQSAVADITNSSSSEISNGCCLFDFGMLIPVLLGFVGLIVVSRIAMKSGGNSSSGGGIDPATSQENNTANLIAQLSSQVSNFSASPQSASVAGTRARTVPATTMTGRSSAVMM